MQSSTTLVDIGNGQRASETVIGTVTVREPFTRRTSEQTACNWREIEIQPGTYEVRLRGRDVLIRYDGIKVDEYFVNRLFHASSVAEKRGIGEPTPWFTQLYPYDAAREFATNPDWELAEDWQVEMVTRRTSDGRTRKSYSIDPLA